MARMTTKATANPVPQDDSEARAAIRELGDLGRELARIEADMGDMIANVQEDFGKAAEPVRARMDALRKGIQTFAEANRNRLTKDGKVKFHRFETGEISWRTRPPKVTVRGKDAVIDELLSAGLGRFVRTRQDVNKDAIMASEEDRRLASGVPGITIGSEGEDFIIEPYDQDLAETG